MKTLQEFLTECSDAATALFEKDGEIPPMWVALTRASEQLLIPAPSNDKNTTVTVMRALFELRDVVRYVHIDEAWTVAITQRPDEDAQALKARAQQLGGSVRNHPDCVEVVMLTGEDETAGFCTGLRVIHRHPRRAYLGPLEITTPATSEGRMIGLLPQRGTRQ